MDKKIQKRKINTSMNYTDMLSTYGVKELKDIAKKWSLKGYSKMKKDELVEVIYACICDELATELFTFNYDHFSIVTGLSEGINDTLKYPVAADQLIDMGLLVEGIVNDERQLILPEEVFNIFKNFYSEHQNIIESNTLIKDFLEIMINLYGVFTVDFFFERLMEFANINIQDQFKEYVLNYSCEATKNAKLTDQYLHYILLEEYQKVYTDILQKEEIKHKIIDDALLKRFIDQGNYFWTETHDQLNQLLVKHLDFKVMDVYMLLDEMRIMLSYNHGIADFIQHVTKKFDLDMVVVKELAECLITINNEMPHWELKGNAPMELSKFQKQEPIVKGKKIGRNDPCPCGSGKKYKKCCLKSS